MHPWRQRREIFQNGLCPLESVWENSVSRCWSSADCIQINNNLGRDGFKLLWVVFTHSQPTFNPTKLFPNPTWFSSWDVSTLAKRWILYFRFMGKSPDVGYTSDTEQSTFFLWSIQEPALISQAQSLLVSIINENQLVPVMIRGQAPLPTHLKITVLAETLAQTIQPIDNELDYSPTTNHFQQHWPGVT